MELTIKQWITLLVMLVAVIYVVSPIDGVPHHIFDDIVVIALAGIIFYLAFWVDVTDSLIVKFPCPRCGHTKIQITYPKPDAIERQATCRKCKYSWTLKTEEWNKISGGETKP